MLNEKKVYDIIDKLPDDTNEVISFVKNKYKDEFKREYIIYSSLKKKKTVLCHCTSCGHDFPQDYCEACVGCSCGCYGVPAHYGFVNSEFTDNVYSYFSTICPVCSTQVKAMHISDLKKPKADITICVAKIHVIDDAICIITYQYDRYVMANGNFCDDVNIIDANIITKDFKAYVSASFKSYNPYTGRRYVFRAYWTVLSKYERCADSMCKRDFLPFDASKLVGTAFENSKLDLYIEETDDDIGVYPSLYLEIFLRYPYIENLVMNGATYLINERFKQNASLKSFIGYKGINLKERKPAFMFNLNKEEFNTFIRLALPLNSIVFYAKHKKIFPFEDFIYYEAETPIDEFELLAEYPFGFLKPLRYLEKCYNEPGGAALDVVTLTDYWKIMMDIGIDFEPFPQNLKTAHDNACKLQKKNNSKIKQKKYKNRFLALSKYIFEYNGIRIAPFKSDTELYNEGKELHHCVYSYADKYIIGKTALFSIRDINKSKVPFFTLELNEENLTVRQNRGKFNCDRTKEIIEFEAKWLEHIKQIKTKEKENGE